MCSCLTICVSRFPQTSWLDTMPLLTRPSLYAWIWTTSLKVLLQHARSDRPNSELTSMHRC